jgi:hypothetical protein
MKKVYLFVVFAYILFSANVIAQTAPTNFQFTTEEPPEFSYSINGFGNNFSENTTFNVVFGRQNATTPGVNRIMTQFQIGALQYFPITFPNGDIYDRVVVNRVPNASVADMDKQTLFFETGGSSGNTRYFIPEYTRIVEAINRRIVNRGSDNIFNNSGGSTTNNVERVDLMFTGGVFTPIREESGFLISERGGNDNIKVAAITSLDVNNNVSSLGQLVNITTSDWGNTGINVATTVFQKFSTDAELRPNQNLGSQPIAGVYVTFEDLGIANNETIYGICIFPNDVTSSMDLVGLTDVPLNTNQGSDGGLDMMGGGGFFVSENVLGVDLMVNLSFVEPVARVGDVITLNITVDNNGPFFDNDVNTATLIPNGYSIVGLVPGYEGNASITGNEVTWNLNQLNPGQTRVLQVRVEVLPAGNRTFESEVSGFRTDFNPGNNQDEIQGAISVGPIEANNDDYSALPINGVSGGSPGNILSNDLLNDTPVNFNDVSIELIFNDGLPGIVIDNDGTFNVPANSLGGTYNVEYRICENASPANCDNAIVTVVVEDGSCPPPPSPNLSRVQSATGNGTNATATFASQPTEGNLLVAIAGYRVGVSGSPNGLISGSGWTRHVNRRHSSNDGFQSTGIAIFTKFAGPAEAASITTNWSDDREHILVIQEFEVPDNAFYELVFNSQSSNTTGENYNSSLGSGNAGNSNQKQIFAISGVVGGVNTDLNAINYNNAFGNSLLETASIIGNPFLGTANRNFFSTGNNTNVTATFRDASNSNLFMVASAGIITFEVVSIASPPDGAILSVNPQSCGNPNGTIEVTSPLGADFEYTIDGGDNYQDDPIFDNLNFGDYFIRVRTKSTGCVGPPERATLVPAICAFDDTFPPILTSGGSAGNVLDNDEINGSPISNLADIDGAPVIIDNGGLTGVSIAADGTLTVPNGTARGVYEVEYEICLSVDNTVCDRAIATVTVVDIEANDDDFTGTPINGYVGGTTASVHTQNQDLLSGVAVDNNDITTSLINNGGLTGASINNAGEITVPAGTRAGTYVLTYRICEDAASFDNCDEASATMLVNPPSIQANDDATGNHTVAGATNVTNVYNNDLLNGVAVIPAEVVLSIPVPDPTSTIILNSDGTVDIAADGTVGERQLTYRLCEVLNPTNCNDAIVTATITPNINAVDDDAGTQTVAGANNVLNVLSNDFYHDAGSNSVGATTGNIDISFISESAANVFTLNTSSGQIDIQANAPVGSHSLVYRITDKDDVNNFDQATVTVEITPNVVANDDNAGTHGIAGATNAINVLTNDFYHSAGANSVSATTGNVNISFVSESAANVFTLNTGTGQIDILPNVPAGTYTLTYRICDANDATNCDNAVVTVQITAPPINAVNDNLGSFTISGTNNAGNVLTNDSFNSGQATVGNVSISVDPSESDVITLNTTTGQVSVEPNSPAGVHTLDYEICDQLNPTNCSTATIEVEIQQGVTFDTDLSPGCLCRNDAPWLVYNISVNYAPAPANGSPLTIRFLDSDDRTLITTVTTEFRNNQRDSILWPGASVDAEGNGNNWPGWVDEGEGWFEDLTQNFGNTRPSSFIQFQLNPESEEILVEYPLADAECAAEPTSFLLPVTWLSFNGRTERGGNYLTWSTASELNNDYFEVQRSIDGQNFEVIGYVQGNGTTSMQSNYAFIDKEPSVGYNYYRLRQVDFDGTDDFSRTIVINTTGEGFGSLKVFPNPTSGLVVIDRGDQEIGEIILKDAAGRVLRSERIMQKTARIDLSTFESGIYFLSDAFGSTVKIIKL